MAFAPTSASVVSRCFHLLHEQLHTWNSRQLRDEAAQLRGPALAVPQAFIRGRGRKCCLLVVGS